MSRSLKTDIPGPDRRITPEDVRAKGLADIFGPELSSPLRLVVEIGFGGGEFLRQLAAQAPDVAHLGVELQYKRVVKLARRVARCPSSNLRLLLASAGDVVGELLDDASVDTFWINFPDPWPKLRHHRRRLLQPGFVAALARGLRPGGSLEVATDHEGYARWIDEVLCAEPLLENREAERFVREVPGRMHTAYEERWRSLGRSLHFWRYRRR